MTGIGEAKIFSRICRAASGMPPAVFNRIRMAAAFCCFAWLRARSMISTVIG
jgi:hypothetical protein